MLLEATEAAHSILKEQWANTENMTSFWILPVQNIRKKRHQTMAGQNKMHHISKTNMWNVTTDKWDH